MIENKQSLPTRPKPLPKIPPGYFSLKNFAPAIAIPVLLMVCAVSAAASARAGRDDLLFATSFTTVGLIYLACRVFRALYLSWTIWQWCRQTRETLLDELDAAMWSTLESLKDIPQDDRERAEVARQIDIRLARIERVVIHAADAMKQKQQQARR